MSIEAKVIKFDSLEDFMAADLPQEVKDAIASKIRKIEAGESEVTREDLKKEFKAEIEKARDAHLAEAEAIKAKVDAGELTDTEAMAQGLSLLLSAMKTSTEIRDEFRDKAEELGLLREDEKEATCTCGHCHEQSDEEIAEENAKVEYASEITKDVLDFLRRTQDMDVNTLHPMAKEAFESAATLTVFALLEMGKIK